MCPRAHPAASPPFSLFSLLPSQPIAPAPCRVVAYRHRQRDAYSVEMREGKMTGLPFKITDCGKRGIITAEKEFFERDCILRVVSEYTHKYFISFYPDSEYSIKIDIAAKDNSDIDEILLKEFFNKCIDTQIKIDLQKEFGDLRQRIVDYAFLAVERNRA